MALAHFYLIGPDSRAVTERILLLHWQREWITQYQITHHSWNSRKHAKEFSEIRIRARLYLLYCFFENMSDYAIPDNVSFLNFSETCQWHFGSGGRLGALEGNSVSLRETLGPGWEYGYPNSSTNPAMENRFAQDHEITRMIPGRSLDQLSVINNRLDTFIVQKDLFQLYIRIHNKTSFIKHHCSEWWYVGPLAPV